jgi:hypothetical protein
MIETKLKIWIWMQASTLHKAVLNTHEKTLTIYNEYDEILFTRRGVTPDHVKAISIVFSKIGAKRVDQNKEPFTYL